MNPLHLKRFDKTTDVGKASPYISIHTMLHMQTHKLATHIHVHTHTHARARAFEVEWRCGYYDASSVG